MAYIGNTATTQAFTPAVDYFNGDGSTVAFTLSKPVASVAQVQAVIENVPQNPGSAYTVSGNTITFTSAPPSGTANIYVYYTSPITQVIAPSQGTVGSSQLQSDLDLTGSLTVDGTTLVVDDTNNRVGIGTASPSSALHVVGSQLRLQTNNCSHQFYNTAGSRYAYLEAASGGLVIDVESGGGSKFIVRSSGSEKIQVNQYGLCFNGDTAAANALDDYEEGTWTPVFISASGSFSSITYQNRTGTYVKIGSVVYVTCNFYTSAISVGTASGAVRISGLPFTASSTEFGIALKGDIRTFAGEEPIAAQVDAGSTYIGLYYRSSVTGDGAESQVSDLGTGVGSNIIGVTGFYFV